MKLKMLVKNEQLVFSTAPGQKLSRTRVCARTTEVYYQWSGNQEEQVENYRQQPHLN